MTSTLLKQKFNPKWLEEDKTRIFVSHKVDWIKKNTKKNHATINFFSLINYNFNNDIDYYQLS